MNPLFNLLGGGNGNPMPNSPLGNFMNFMNQYRQFRQSFNGNAQQQVQNMLNSGQISKERYDQAVQMVNQIQQFMSGKF